jgi:hypothetical protein
LHLRIIGLAVAVIAELLAACGKVRLEARCAHEAALVADPAILEAKAAEMAVGMQGGIVGEFGRIEPLAAQPGELPVKIGGDGAGGLAFQNVGLVALRRKETAGGGQRGKIDHGRACLG